MHALPDVVDGVCICIGVDVGIVVVESIVNKILLIIHVIMKVVMI